MVGANKSHCLCLPEAIVDKIEDNMPQFEESITTVIAEEEKKSKKEFRQVRNRLFGEVKEAKPIETTEEFGDELAKQIERYHEIEKEHAQKLRQQKFECQGSDKFNPDHLCDTVDEEHQNFKQEGGGLDLHGHDKADVHPQSYSKSQAPSGSQTHSASEEHSVLAYNGTGPTNNCYVGSMVQIPSPDEDNPFRYGVIKWIGLIPRVSGRVAGIKLVSY